MHQLFTNGNKLKTNSLNPLLINQSGTLIIECTVNKLYYYKMKDTMSHVSRTNTR